MVRFLDVAIESIGADPAADGCEACGHPWRPEVDAAVAAIHVAPDRYAEVLEGGDPYRVREPLTWSPTAYTWHVADVCHAWAERVISLREEPDRPLAAFDPDALATARGYDAMSVSAAQWALEHASRSLIAEMGRGGTDLEFDHPEWGEGTLGDALRWVAHELVHHRHDIAWILS